MERIIILADFFRESELYQVMTSWLLEIFRHQISQVTGIEPSIWGTDEKSKEILFNYRSLGFSADSDWVSLYGFSADDFPSLFVERFLETVDKNTLIIGFELPDSLIDLLNKHAVTYITVMHHPVRFLNDLMLGFKSNSRNITAKLKNYEAKDDLFYITASQYSASHYTASEKIYLEPNSLLLCGQTAVDRSLICNGKILSLEFFEKDLTDLFSRFESIYFKSHPYNYNSQSVIKKLSRKYNIVDISNYNAYDLLACPEINTVAAISSGIVYEAKYFNKATKYLFKYPFKLSHDYPGDANVYIPIHKDFLNPFFWKKILGAEFTVNEDVPDIDFLDHGNFMRNSLNRHWGYLTYEERKIVNISSEEPLLNILKRKIRNKFLKSLLKK